tara:strand:- start:232 stop:459 length:228 start_codon:yes stop_codon:yes gene_type:complete
MKDWSIKMKTFMLLDEVVHMPSSKKATVITTKVDTAGKQLIELKYENGTTGWVTPDTLATFIQDSVDYEGEFLTE